MKAIYDKIIENTTDEGILAPSFSVYDLNMSDDPYAHDGARDAILLYHRSEIKTIKRDFATIFFYFCDGDYRQAMSILNELFLYSTVVQNYDVLQGFLREFFKDGEDKFITKKALDILIHSDNIEMIKFCLLLLQFVPADKYPELESIVRTFALSDEFTFFCSLVAENWKDGSQVIFKFAKKVKGWGRTLVIPRLDLQDPKVALWLLEEGYQNTASPEYTYTVILSQSIVPNLLIDPNLEEEHFRTFNTMFLGSLENWPMLVTFEDLDPELQVRLVSWWLDRTEEFSFDATANEIVIRLNEYFDYLDMTLEYYEESDSGTETSAMDEILQAFLPFKAKIEKLSRRIAHVEAQENSQERYLSEAAEDQELIVQANLGQKIRTRDFTERFLNEPAHYTKLLIMLLQHKDKYKGLLDHLISILPLNELATGPLKPRKDDTLQSEEKVLDAIVIALRYNPWEGRELLLAALQSPQVTTRLSASITLMIWLAYGNESLETADPELYQLLTALLKVEKNQLVCHYLKDAMYLST